MQRFLKPLWLDWCCSNWDVYKWPKLTHPDVDNEWLICYLPLWCQMLDIFSFCLSYWERSCNLHYLFCGKLCLWHVTGLIVECAKSLFFFFLCCLISCRSPEVVEKVSPPAPVAIPPSIESQDISPTQLAGESSIQSMYVYLGCTLLLISLYLY